MAGERRLLLPRYAIALAVTALALLSTAGLRPFLGPNVFPLLALAVVATAWQAGLGPGLVTAGLGTLFGAHLLLAQEVAQTAGTPAFLMRVGLFLGAGAAAAWLTDRLRSAKLEAEETARRLRENQEGLRQVATGARCLLWRAEIEEAGSRLRWRMEVSDLESAQRLLPLEVPPGMSYPQAWYASRLPEDRVRTDAYGNAQVRAGRSYSQEFRCRDRWGEIRWLKEDVQIEPIGPGRWRAVGVCTDMTDRRRVEEELRASEERFRRLAENAPDVIYRYRFRPSPGFDYIGPAVARITGYAPEDFYADPKLPCEIIHPEDRVLLEGLAHSPVHADTLITLRWRRRDGTLLWTDHRVTPLYDAGGELLAVEGIARDISERRELEEQLRQAQKMEAVGTLAGGIAHDFNNMLAVITGYSELLLHAADPSDPTRRYLEEIKNAGDRAAALTRQLLAFSRKQVLAPRILDLNHAIRRMEGMLHRLIGEDIEMETALAPDLERVKVDPGHVDQLLLNLASNARDAMPTGGRLTIETRNVDLDETYARQHAGVTAGPYVMLAVADTGCGMDAATQARIFEPFFTTKETGKGTGIGLATVFGIVRQSAGHIRVESSPGQGSTFRLYFPAVQESEANRGDTRPEPQVLHGYETVLLVEDERMVRGVAREALLRHGYNVLEASNASEALLLARAHRGEIHLLVTDVVLPGMSGRELAEHLIALHPELRVLFISGYTDDAILRHGVQAEQAAFLQKPFPPDDLARSVRKILG